MATLIPQSTPFISLARTRFQDDTIIVDARIIIVVTEAIDRVVVAVRVSDRSMEVIALKEAHISVYHHIGLKIITKICASLMVRGKRIAVITLGTKAGPLVLTVTKQKYHMRYALQVKPV